MAGAVFLGQEKATAIQEAIETVEDLLGGQDSSERLTSAQHDATGRTMPDYVSSMVIAELVRVVAAQEERIKKLEARPQA
jgi:hypothetical protein